MTKKKVSLPQFGNYSIPFEYIITHGLEMDYITPPPMTRRTLEIGSKYSPDYVCAPFKLNIGSFIEAIEAGADTIAQISGDCRLGYYGELQEQILRDLSYDVTFVNLANCNKKKPLTYIKEFQKINPELSIKKLVAAFANGMTMVKYMDDIDAFIRRHIGFEREMGRMEEIYSQWLDELRSCDSKKEMKALHSITLKRLKRVELNKPKKLLKVGVVGEYYTIMDSFSNHNLERELAQMGMYIDRWMDLTNSLFHYKDKDMLPKIKAYCDYSIGATAMATVDAALKYAKQGYDGIIHVKSFGCTPETDAVPVLQNISADYKIPILYLSYDSQTSDTGLKTRLEAFYDMIYMRK